MSAKYVEIILIKIPVNNIPDANKLKSNISWFKAVLSELNSVIILGFIYVNEYHIDKRNITAKVDDINPW